MANYQPQKSEIELCAASIGITECAQVVKFSDAIHVFCVDTGMSVEDMLIAIQCGVGRTLQTALNLSMYGKLPTPKK